MAAIIYRFSFVLFFAKKKQKFSIVTSDCHIGMRVGAFEISDNEETFFIFAPWS